MNDPRDAEMSMLAAMAQTYGEPIRVCSIARPKAEAGQVLVRIHASGVNPLDTTNQGRAHHREILTHASRLVEAGRVTPHLDPRRFTMDTIAEAYQALTSRTAVGRLVVDVGGTT